MPQIQNWHRQETGRSLDSVLIREKYAISDGCKCGISGWIGWKSPGGVRYRAPYCLVDILLARVKLTRCTEKSALNIWGITAISSDFPTFANIKGIRSGVFPMHWDKEDLLEKGWIWMDWDLEDTHRSRFALCMTDLCKDWMLFNLTPNSIPWYMQI